MECCSIVSDVDTRAATDLSHTRNTEPPGLCRYLHVDPIDYSCPACRTHKRAEHPDHTNVEGECRAPVTRRTAGRRRTQGNSREPAIRGAGDSSDRRRLTADDELEYPPPPRPAELQAQEEATPEATPVVQPPVQQEPELYVRTLDKDALGKPTSRYKQAEAPQKTSELSMSHGQ